VSRPDYLARNQAAWDEWADEYREPGRKNWGSEPAWGIWGIPESEVGLLPEVGGKDTIELGCGTGYVSAWLARRGARPVGIDLSPRQLATAREFQREFDLSYPLLRAPAERVPFADGSFDFAISEYGAALWSDPHLWIPEAARLLRPGGSLVFLVNASLLVLCAPDVEGVAAGTELLRPFFGLHRIEWPAAKEVEFHLGHGDWIRLLRRNGFEIEDLIELRPSENAVTRYPFVTLDWARRWPCEEVWKVRKVWR